MNINAFPKNLAKGTTTNLATTGQRRDRTSQIPNSYKDMGTGKTVSFGTGGNPRDYDLSTPGVDKSGVLSKSNSFERNEKRDRKDKEDRYGHSNTPNLDNPSGGESKANSPANRFADLIKKQTQTLASISHTINNPFR